MKILLKLLNLLKYIIILFVCMVLLVSCIGAGIIMADKYKNHEYPFETANITSARSAVLYTNVVTQADVLGTWNFKDTDLNIVKYAGTTFPITFVRTYDNTSFSSIQIVDTGSTQSYRYRILYGSDTTVYLSSNGTTGYWTSQNHRTITIQNVSLLSQTELETLLLLLSENAAKESELPPTPTEDSEWGLYGVINVWRITDKPQFDSVLDFNINFESNGQKYSEIAVNNNGTDQDPVYNLYFDKQKVYDSSNNTWTSGKYKWITITGISENIVPEELATWLLSISIQVNYNDGYNEGQDYGYAQGYNKGLYEGQNAVLGELTGWDAVKGAITSVFKTLEIKVFGFFSLGDVIMVCLVLTVVLFFLKIVRG